MRHIVDAKEKFKNKLLLDCKFALAEWSATQ